MSQAAGLRWRLVLRSGRWSLSRGNGEFSCCAEFDIVARVEERSSAVPGQRKVLQPHGSDHGYFIATMIGGTLELGVGDAFDIDGLQTLGPSSVFTHPASVQHFDRSVRSIDSCEDVFHYCELPCRTETFVFNPPDTVDGVSVAATS